MITTTITLVFTGIFGGILAGLTGIGGGIIYILALQFFLEKIGIPSSEIVQFTIANSILAVFFATLSANIKLFKLKEIYTKQILIVSSASILSSLLMLRYFVNTSLYSKSTFDIIITLLLIYLLFKVIKKAVSISQNTELINASNHHFLLGGIGGGIIASLSGLGGGVIMVPVFNTLIGLNSKTSRSISLGVITLTTMVMSINNLSQSPTSLLSSTTHYGYIIPSITLPVVTGVLLGGYIGVSLSKKLSGKSISTIYSVFLALFIIKKIIEFTLWR